MARPREPHATGGDSGIGRAVAVAFAPELGALDVLANIAGYQMSFESFADIPAADIERVYRLCQAAVRVMKPGASIINTASIQAYQPSPSILHYSSSKGAIARSPRDSRRSSRRREFTA